MIRAVRGGFQGAGDRDGAREEPNKGKRCFRVGCAWSFPGEAFVRTPDRGRRHASAHRSTALRIARAHVTEKPGKGMEKFR
ncbi:hypothetical protein GCM10017600_00650 [Streptosporangium carneum]|uniref:Uncharacterized protein n=1 Tax=Streptosporangium carneum TaxID=47481 RepID=A0A9W6HUN3_9ACTN|nr:hypothetical protein GCM10017600_00650 [Streptosporangium carneum]